MQFSYWSLAPVWSHYRSTSTMPFDPDEPFEEFAEKTLPIWGPFYAMFYIIRYVYRQLRNKK